MAARVLLLADSKMLPALASGLREGGRFEVLTAGTPQQAAELLGEQPQAVVFFYGCAEWTLPAALAALQPARDKGVHLIAVLQKAQQPLRDECFRSGASDAFFMPIPKDRFVARLADAVGLAWREDPGLPASVQVASRSTPAAIDAATVTPVGVYGETAVPFRPGQTARMTWKAGGESFASWGLVAQSAPARVRFAGLTPEEESRLRSWLKATPSSPSLPAVSAPLPSPSAPSNPRIAPVVTKAPFPTPPEGVTPAHGAAMVPPPPSIFAPKEANERTAAPRAALVPAASSAPAAALVPEAPTSPPAPIVPAAPAAVEAKEASADAAASSAAPLVPAAPSSTSAAPLVPAAPSSTSAASLVPAAPASTSASPLVPAAPAATEVPAATAAAEAAASESPPPAAASAPAAASDLKNLFDEAGLSPPAGLPAAAAEPVSLGHVWPEPWPADWCRGAAAAILHGQPLPTGPAGGEAVAKRVLNKVTPTERAAAEKPGEAGPSPIADSWTARIALAGAELAGENLAKAGGTVLVDGNAFAALLALADAAGDRLQQEANTAIAKGDTEALRTLTGSRSQLSQDVQSFKKTADKLRGLAAAAALGPGELDPEVQLSGRPAARPRTPAQAEAAALRRSDFTAFDQAPKKSRQGLIAGVLGVLLFVGLLNLLFFSRIRFKEARPGEMDRAGHGIVRIAITEKRALVVVTPLWGEASLENSKALIATLAGMKVEQAVVQVSDGRPLGTVDVVQKKASLAVLSATPPKEQNPDTVPATDKGRPDAGSPKKP